MTAVHPHSEERTLRFHTPNSPDVPDRYGPGSIKPTGVRITYRQDEDGERTVTALVKGTWRRASGELTGDPCSQHYSGHRPHEEWPDWLAQLARDHEPEDWKAALWPRREQP